MTLSLRCAGCGRSTASLGLCLFFFGPCLVLVGVLLPPAEAQSQRAFTLLKELEQQKLFEELQLIRLSQRCVDGARNLEALQTCHRQERLREWQQREEFRRRIDAVRARFGLHRPGGDRGASPGPPPHGPPPSGPPPQGPPPPGMGGGW